MLSEKFFLFIEALIKDRAYGAPTYSDGGPRVISSSQHVPLVLSERDARSSSLPRS